MGLVETWGPVADIAERLYNEAIGARKWAGTHNRDNSFDFLLRMSEKEIEVACLGAAMGMYLSDTDDAEEMRKE